MNSERNVRPSGCVVERVADLDRQLADPGDDRLQRGDERQDDLAASVHLELAGASLCPVAQPGEQLAGGLAAGVAVALEERREPLLTQPASVERGWGSGAGTPARSASRPRRTPCWRRARNTRADRAAG